jgi:nitroreductase
MDALTCLHERKTCRGFLPKTNPPAVAEDILTDAVLAPSASNHQPRQFHLIEGSALEHLNHSIKKAHQEQRKGYDPSKGKTIPACYVDRTKKLFKGIRPFISQLGDGNASFIESGSFCFYNAPTVVLITLHRDMPETRYMDIGMAAQNIMLSAHARGLSSCAIALTLMYADAIQTSLNLPEDTLPALFISIGYADENFVVNRFRSEREDTEKLITRHA